MIRPFLLNSLAPERTRKPTAIIEILTRLDFAVRRSMTFASRDIAAQCPASQWIPAQSSRAILCSKMGFASRRSGRASNRWRPAALTLRRRCVALGRSCFTKSPAGQCVAKSGIENANGRIRRWLPRQTDLDDLSDEEIQDIAMTLNLTPRKCLGFRPPAEAFLNELGKPFTIRFNARVVLRV